jgi:hypothetical protein
VACPFSMRWKGAKVPCGRLRVELPPSSNAEPTLPQQPRDLDGLPCRSTGRGPHALRLDLAVYPPRLSGSGTSLPGLSLGADR